MKQNAAAWFACLLAVLVQAGCDGGMPDPESIETHEEAAEAVFTSIEQVADLLEGIETQADADAASAEITTLAENIEAITRKLGTLPPLTAEEGAKLRDAIKPRNEAVNQRIQAALDRIKDTIPGHEGLADAVWDLNFSQLRGSRPDRDEPAHMTPGASRTHPKTPIQMESLIQRYGETRVATIAIEMPTQASSGRVGSDLRRMLFSIGITDIREDRDYQGSQFTLKFYVAPIDDLQALANKITVGRIEGVDQRQRVINVTYEE